MMKIPAERILVKVQQDNPRKTFRNVLIELMPQRLADIILKKAGIEASIAHESIG